MNVTVTFFPNFAAATKHEQTLPIEKLAAHIRQTSKPRKEDLPWLKLARFGEMRTKERCLRNNANVTAISGIEADYDGEKIGFDMATQIITEARLCAIVYTSPSHDEDRPRWRILCPLSMEYPAVDRDRLFARLNGLFGDIFSAESWRLAQSYYFGAIRQNPSHRVVVTEGVCIDQADNLDATAIGKPEPKVASGNGEYQPGARPEAISDKRINGMVATLLDNVRRAPDGQKHPILFDQGRALGGYLHLTNWTAEQAATELVAALPASVKNWNKARKTARDAIACGMAAPLMLEDRPAPRSTGRKWPEEDPGYWESVAADESRHGSAGNGNDENPNRGVGGKPPEAEAAERASRGDSTRTKPAEAEPPQQLSLKDFWAYMPMHNYIFAPLGEHWPAASVNMRLPPVKVTAANSEARDLGESDRFKFYDHMKAYIAEPPEVLRIATTPLSTSQS